MIIFHSREALTARLAALLYAGRLDREATPEQAWEAMAARQAHRAEGLWPVGYDRWGDEVYALGRASRHDVVERVFHGLAGVFGIEPGSFLLIDVGPVHAWGDLPVLTLRQMGLAAPARALELRQIARRWTAASRAAGRALFRMGERHRP